jgi:ferritin-like metal-binding protein YciE
VKHHVNSLENHVDKDLELKMGKRTNTVIDAIMKETNNNLLSCSEYNLADVCLIFGLQTINHYKISAYGPLATIAEMLGKNKLAFLIRELEGNEKTTDLNLTEIAIHGINQAAIIGIGR